MKPIDFRNETWATLQTRLAGDRAQVLAAYRKYGPQTTRELSRLCGMDILSVRPRTTELFQMGFLELEPSESKTEGRYRALTDSQARLAFETQRAMVLRDEALDELAEASARLTEAQGHLSGVGSETGPA